MLILQMWWVEWSQAREINSCVLEHVSCFWAGILSPDLFIYPSPTPLQNRTDCLKPALIAHAPHVITLLKKILALNSVLCLWISRNTCATTKKPMDLVCCHSSLELFMFNIKWQHIITPGSCNSCESEIWKSPLCYKGGCHGDDYVGWGR